MKLRDRVPVDGMTPVLYTGHHLFKNLKTWQRAVCKQWHAECNHDDKRFSESLKTTNKAAAITAAHRIFERIDRGDVRQVQRRVEGEPMRDDYMSFLRSKGRAPKTIEKHEYGSS